MRTSQSVTTQLQTLLPLFRDHEGLTALLGQKARDRVLERYKLSENITGVEALYQQVFHDRPKPTAKVVRNIFSRSSSQKTL